MRRFTALKENISNNTVALDKEQSAHITRVLRLGEGDKIIVSALDGIDRICVLTKCGEFCEARIIEERQNDTEPRCALTLFQAVIKNDKMDFVIQKATEIGVKKIVPVICERTVVQLNEKGEKKRERWQKIALEACKQCERGAMPEVCSPVSFNEALEMLKEYPQAILCYEDEHTVSITEAVEKADKTAYFIGPEGGLTEREHKSLVEAGAKSVSLGRRILRAETAAIVCGGVVLALVGDMNA